ncbi:MAG: hypothetical protein D6770_08085 [Anaerolineae bacterium]|nr:MAG: hypothetical protein D6770_08085 [Anaerolineae bacterium]
MRHLKTQIRITMVLGVLCLFLGVLSHLALTDIFHGEADTSLEWNIVRLSAIVFLAFISLALLTLRQTLRAIS